MLMAYLVSLSFGGTILLVTLLVGGDGDGDGHGDGLDGAYAWFPFASLRFWTSFLAFAGVTGALLTAGGVHSPLLVGGVAAAVGGATAMGVRAAALRLGRGTGSIVGRDDLIGATGHVVLPVGPGRTGKVRLQIKGRTVERIAETEEGELVERDGEVLVHEVTANGRVRVVRA